MEYRPSRINVPLYSMGVAQASRMLAGRVSKLSFAEMVDFLKLKRFGSLVDDEMDQQVFILDLSFNPEITDELMVTYFDLNKEIFCITHES